MMPCNDAEEDGIAHALDTMARLWGMDPVKALRPGPLGTGISAAWWQAPNPAERVVRGCGGDTWILAYHASGLGRARMMMDGAQVYDGTVSAGTWLLVPPGAMPRAEVRGSWDVLHLYIPQDFMARLASGSPGASLRSVATRCARLIRDPHIAPLLRALQAEAGPLAETHCANIAARLLHDYGRAATPQRGREQLAPWQLARIETLIDAEACDGLRAEDVSAALGLSRSHLSRAYRKSTGATLQDAIMQRRLDAARALLETTDRAVTDIAMETGFASASHMATTFRTRLGQSPTALRKAALS